MMIAQESDSIPLYLGIPLALLCVAVVAFVIAIGFAIWNDSKHGR